MNVEPGTLHLARFWSLPFRRRLFDQLPHHLAVAGEPVGHWHPFLILDLVDAHPAAPLVVFVGDGPLRDELQKQAGPRVQFLGQRADVAELLTGFDVFVLSSEREGLSMSMLEAMRASRPAVVTDVGGNGEAVEHGVTGLGEGYLAVFAPLVFTAIVDLCRPHVIGHCRRGRIARRSSADARAESRSQCH